MKQRLLALSLLFAIMGSAQDVNIIPKPSRTVKMDVISVLRLLHKLSWKKPVWKNRPSS